MASNTENKGFGARGELLVVIQFALIILFVLLPVWHPFVGAAVMDATGPWRLGLGALLGLVAVVFGALGSVHIRKYLTPLPYPVDHNQLVQHGVYAVVRHPLYASQIFAAAAWSVYNLSLSHLLVLVVAFAFFDHKANKEEAWLTERHPDYADYATRVRKFIPLIY